MNKRQMKFYWVLLHEWLEREQTSFPPDNMKELWGECKQMSDHLQDCMCEKTIPEIKQQAIQLEANNHPDGNGFAFYESYCAQIGEDKKVRGVLKETKMKKQIRLLIELVSQERKRITLELGTPSNSRNHADWLELNEERELCNSTTATLNDMMLKEMFPDSKEYTLTDAQVEHERKCQEDDFNRHLGDGSVKW